MKVAELWNKKIYGAGENGETICMPREDGFVHVLNPHDMTWHRWFSDKSVQEIKVMRSMEPVYGLCFIQVTIKEKNGLNTLYLHPLEPANVATFSTK